MPQVRDPIRRRVVYRCARCGCTADLDGRVLFGGNAVLHTADAPDADLRIFWGPEICRLEYLVHLIRTGRVKE